MKLVFDNCELYIELIICTTVCNQDSSCATCIRRLHTLRLEQPGTGLIYLRRNSDMILSGTLLYVRFRIRVKNRRSLSDSDRRNTRSLSWLGLAWRHSMSASDILLYGQFIPPLPLLSRSKGLPSSAFAQQKAHGVGRGDWETQWGRFFVAMDKNINRWVVCHWHYSIRTSLKWRSLSSAKYP